MTLMFEPLSARGMFVKSRVDPGPFTCPVCRMVSFNPNDSWHGYCAGCKATTALPFDGPGTKVLVVGDTGRDLDWLRGTVIQYAQAAGCTRIMQCGDFGFVWDKETVDRELDDIHHALDAAGVTLTFLPGNHENHPLLERLADAADHSAEGHAMLRPTIHYTGRICTWTWDGLRLAAIGGAPSIDRWDRVPGTSWWPEEKLGLTEVSEATELGPVDVLFSHDAPAGVPMNLVPDLEGTVHRTYMSQIGAALVPAYWYHGHYHESLFYRFHHVLGAATVRGLGHNRSESPLDAMAAINLRSIREGLNVTHCMPEI